MKIAIVGYGVEGRALAKYLGAKGHDITVCDISARLGLAGPKRALPKGRGASVERSETELVGETVGFPQKKLQFRFGPHYLEKLENFDVVFRSPGIPFLRPEFQKIKERVTSLTRFFFEHCPCPIVGVTGTKGKGTTASLIFEMLRGAAQKGRKVFLGGNIGRTPLEFLDGLTAHDVVILELSSFQLQDLNMSPHVAVVLGITPDHLDHHRDIYEYTEAKKNIVKFQDTGDFAIFDADNKRSADFQKETKANVRTVSIQKPVEAGGFLKAGTLLIKKGKTGMAIGEKSQTRLPGEHNLKNILAAAVAADILNVPIEIISKVIREWPGLPHRLEFVCETRGIKFINDSASTNPQTAMAALRAFGGPLILIAGGSDKNMDFTKLGEEIAQRLNVKTVVLMGETQKKLEHAIEQAASVRRREIPLELIFAETYQEAFMVAKMLAQPGDTVLLSPASASFDMFSNYMERGDIFRNFMLS